MECSMKSWQYGYELDHLKSLEMMFSDYNKYTLSPFAKFKKNNIAEALHKKELVLLEDAMFELKHSKKDSPISMHGDTIIGVKKKGDLTIGKLSGSYSTLQREVESLDGNKWLLVWAENSDHVKFAADLGFNYVGPKITSFGEIYSVYYKGETRTHPVVDKAEYLSVKKIGNAPTDSIFSKLSQLPGFKNHYSNYNVDNSWSALSLRGYSSDPSFIINPAEMNKKWQEINKDKTFELQDTHLYQMFPEVRDFCSSLGAEIHRVRFMRLTSNGKLERHTDQVDSDSGGAMGKLARIHLPIKTNKDVKFFVWDITGLKQEIHMDVGEMWFLDTRKPHMAINGGSDERIHLVVDVCVDKNLHRRLIS